MTVLVFVLLSIIGGGLYWVDSTADSCWKYEATKAFENYATLKSRSAIILKVKSFGRDVVNSGSKSIDIIETDPNGCSLGSNGQTVVRFYFDGADKLTRMQVFRNYLTAPPDYKMELIEERSY